MKRENLSEISSLRDRGYILINCYSLRHSGDKVEIVQIKLSFNRNWPEIDDKMQQRIRDGYHGKSIDIKQLIFQEL